MNKTIWFQALCAIAVLSSPLAHAQTNVTAQAGANSNTKIYKKTITIEKNYGDGYQEGDDRGYDSNDGDGYLDDDDWFNHCHNSYTDLARARRHANWNARQGRLGVAAQILKDALYSAAEEYPDTFRRPAPGPHLLKAAQQAKAVLETATSAMSTMKPELRVQVDYLLSNELMELVVRAYKDLDERYQKKMRHDDDCDDCWTKGLPKEYFDGVRDLAYRFIDLQIALKEYEASDLVELKVTRAVVQAAREFISIYTRRRTAYCSALNSMRDLSQDICEYLAHPDYPSYEKIAEVRSEMKEIRSLLDYKNCDCN